MSAATFVSELFLADQFLNVSCGSGMLCDALSDLGPPPDTILSIPPPPVPPFMEDFLSKFTHEGVDVFRDLELESPPDPGNRCNMCNNWSPGNKFGSVELAQKGPLIDDTWFLVIISSSVFLALLGIVMVIGFLKYREGKLKPLSDVVLAKKEKALGLERCEAVLYPGPQVPRVDSRTSRALWAGLKPLEGNHYTVDHCQPMDQKPSLLHSPILTTDNNYDYADYSSITYSTIDRNLSVPQVPEYFPKISGRPTPSSSFENVGFVSGEDMMKIRFGMDSRTMNRAAYLLGNKAYRNPKTTSHIYEMVSPKILSNSHKCAENEGRQTPVISAPTNVSMRLPPLNSRHGGHYTLTALSNGSHTLSRLSGTPAKMDRKFTHVTLGKTGTPNTRLAPVSPNDNLYSSPITSPVI